ncbi:MAG: transcription elongation factor GreA [Anaerolineae bacterium]|jgi:transcription elongation factor GreA
MSEEPVYLTPEGLQDLKKELYELVNVRRPEMAERLRKAIQQGDLSENADYIQGKEEQGFLEGRIQQIEAMLRNAVLIEDQGATDEVRLGSYVTVREEGGSESEVYHLVGSAEADPLNGKISRASPLGQALLGSQVGDTVAIDAPAGEIRFKVVAIE